MNETSPHSGDLTTRASPSAFAKFLFADVNDLTLRLQQNLFLSDGTANGAGVA